jgi:hypothetical protein
MSYKTIVTIPILFIIIATAPAIAFDANAIWLKGTVRIEKYKLLDPRINIDEFQIGNDEEVTLYMTYRAPARDDKKWSKVTYHVEITKPDGQPMEGINPQEEIMGGSGLVPDEHAQDWGISQLLERGCKRDLSRKNNNSG